MSLKTFFLLKKDGFRVRRIFVLMFSEVYDIRSLNTSTSIVIAHRKKKLTVFAKNLTVENLLYKLLKKNHSLIDVEL